MGRAAEVRPKRRPGDNSGYKLREMVRDREAWGASVGFERVRTAQRLHNKESE